MNVYDFDKTIYNGDSTLDFYMYCVKKHPIIVLCLPRQLKAVLRYKLGKIDKTHMKEEFYSFFHKLSNIDEDVKLFWDKNEKKIKQWYKKCQNESDLIISASPFFLLAEVCNRIGVHNLIASEVDKGNGKYNGLNCYGYEKVKRYRKQFDEPINKFYSDSESDQPMALISEKAFLVKGDLIKEWIVEK